MLTTITEVRDEGRVSLRIQAKPPVRRGVIWALTLVVLAVAAVGPLSDAGWTLTNTPETPETHVYSSKDEGWDHGQMGQRPGVRQSWLILLALFVIPLGVGELTMWGWRAASIEVTEDDLRVTSRPRFRAALRNVRIEVERTSTPDEKERYTVTLGDRSVRREIRVTSSSREEAEAVAARIARVVASFVERGTYRRTARDEDSLA